MLFDKSIKVCVLMGGVGAERAVSLDSGKNIAAAIREAGIECVEFDITPDDMSILDDASIDVFFLGLHGKFGEDGELQQILEDKKLVYTGSGPKASADAFDKVVSKEIFAKAGVDLPRHVLVCDGDSAEDLAGRLSDMGDKFVVKPVKQGSSVGVVIVDGCKEAATAGLECFAEFGDCMIEEFIDGREITVGILNGVALPITEIVSKTKFYDYEAKYLADTTEYLFDTITDPALIEKINRSALACYDSLGCRHQSRVDMILSQDGVPYVLEINTLPGFTGHSLLPMAAKRAGMSGSELCLKIIGCE
ncbi:MAG: D-alanine--D-alanine ligase [Phycisphaerae bacterium]|nr:D-alanine--D-alanine ligase [Phycisphaerae bacterium]